MHPGPVCRTANCAPRRQLVRPSPQSTVRCPCGTFRTGMPEDQLCTPDRSAALPTVHPEDSSFGPAHRALFVARAVRSGPVCRRTNCAPRTGLPHCQLCTPKTARSAQPTEHYSLPVRYVPDRYAGGPTVHPGPVCRTANCAPRRQLVRPSPQSTIRCPCGTFRTGMPEVQLCTPDRSAALPTVHPEDSSFGPADRALFVARGPNLRYVPDRYDGGSTVQPGPQRAESAERAPHRTAPPRTAPHRPAPHRTAPHRTAPHRTASRTSILLAGRHPRRTQHGGLCWLRLASYSCQ